MGPGLRLRLSLMMFLQYFLFGTWFVPLGTYMSKGLGFDRIIGNAYGTQGIAAIVSTLLIGVLADRYFAAQKLMGVLALASGATLLLAAQVHASQGAFLAIVMLHFLCFVPTIPLANAVALGCIRDRAGQFPGIRVCGTAGWIAGGVLVGAIPGAAATPLPLQIAGAASLVLGVYCFTLPATPPARTGEGAGWRALLGLDMIRRLRERDFATFIAGVLVILVPLSFYNVYANTFLTEVGIHAQVLGLRIEPAAIQTLGQVSEFGLLLLLPMFLRRFGVKGVLVIGMLAWAVRYGLFALGSSASEGQFTLLIVAVMLHGVCYDFFFVAGQIYVDEIFRPSERARAQSFLVTLNMGVGVVVGSNIANAAYTASTAADGTHGWQSLWLLPGGIALLAGIAFAALFRPRRIGARPGP